MTPPTSPGTNKVRAITGHACEVSAAASPRSVLDPLSPTLLLALSNADDDATMGRGRPAGKVVPSIRTEVGHAREPHG
jgi:hypothetical protein